MYFQEVSNGLFYLIQRCNIFKGLRDEVTCNGLKGQEQWGENTFLRGSG